MDWAALFEFAPGLAATILVVWMFLRHQKERDRNFERVLDAIEMRHHEACKETMVAMDRASDAMSENTRIMGRVDATLQRAVIRLDAV